MREIKFRAWDKRSKKMIILNDMTFGLTPNYITTWEETWGGKDGYEFYQEFCHGEILVRDLEVMQYTGLKDKNGKEIYEGYIVKWNHHSSPIYIGIVKQGYWTNKADDTCGYGWYVQIAHDKYSLGWVDPSIIEIVGNIYENPELLEVKE